VRPTFDRHVIFEWTIEGMFAPGKTCEVKASEPWETGGQAAGFLALDRQGLAEVRGVLSVCSGRAKLSASPRLKGRFARGCLKKPSLPRAVEGGLRRRLPRGTNEANLEPVRLVNEIKPAWPINHSARNRDMR